MLFAMRTYLFLAFLGWSFVAGFAQPNSSIDSLQLEVERSNGSKKFDALVSLMRANLDGDIKQSLAISYQAEALALELDDSLRIVKAKYARGFILRRLDSLDRAIDVLRQALPIASRNQFDDELIRILNTLGLSYTLIGDYAKALQCHFQAVDVNERRKNSEDLAITFNNIGFVYFRLKDYQEAVDFYQQSLRLKKTIGSKYDLDRLLINIALSYNQLQQYQESEKLVQEALSVCGDECSPQVILEAEICWGISLMQQRKEADAVSHFERSLKLAKQENDTRFVMENLYNLALVKDRMAEDKEALSLLHEAELMADKTEYSESLINIYRQFSKIYEERKDYTKASLYQNNYIKLKDSIYSEALITNLAKVQASFEERENIKTIRGKDAILKLKEDLIQRQRVQYFFAVLVTILTIGLLGVLYWANKRQRKSNMELAAAKNKIERINQELKDRNQNLDREVRNRTEELFLANSSLQQVNSELDNFIYKTSHDIRGPLATLKGICSLGSMDVKDALALDYFGKIDDTADHLNRILSRLQIINEINNSDDEPISIVFDALLDHTFEFERAAGVPDNFSMKYEVEPGVGMITDHYVLSIAIGNLVQNAIKFHNDSRNVQPFVNVRVSKQANRVAIRVEDNGIGFVQQDKTKIFQMFMRASERSQTGGVGLYLTKLATERLGGTIELERTSRHGSTFLLLIPDDYRIVLKLREEKEKRLIEQLIEHERAKHESKNELMS